MLAFRGSFDTYAGLFPRDEGKSYGRSVDELQILMLEASDRFTIKSIIKNGVSNLSSLVGQLYANYDPMGYVRSINF